MASAVGTCLLQDADEASVIFQVWSPSLCSPEVQGVEGEVLEEGRGSLGLWHGNVG